MRIFFISDCHFEHGNIIEYCHRPFLNVDYMNATLVERWNKKVSHGDLVYHVGDFYMNKGGEGYRYWQFILNGDIVHIKGNHDRNNGVKTLITKCIMKFGGKTVFVTHRPPHTEGEIPYGCDFCICGHVHELYKHKWVGKYPIINVSVDVWGFEPVSIESILKYYKKIKKEKIQNDRKIKD